MKFVHWSFSPTGDRSSCGRFRVFFEVRVGSKPWTLQDRAAGSRMTTDVFETEAEAKAEAERRVNE